MNIEYVVQHKKGSIFIHYSCDCGNTTLIPIRNDYWYYRLM